MKKVVTRDWGSQFKDLSNLIELKATATAANEEALRAEIERADGSHGYGRHGAQTRWEAQLVRAVTKITPDQVHDPMGVNAELRSWNGVMSYGHNDGAPIFDLFGFHSDAPATYAMKPGNTAGGFITPEAQLQAKAQGELALQALRQPSHQVAVYRFKAEKKVINAPITSVHIVAEPPRVGGLYGLAFARRKDATYPADRDFVIKMIDALQTGKTGAQVYPRGVPPMDMKYAAFIGRRMTRPLFADMGELAGFFDIDIEWQPNCSLIYRREYTPAGRSLGPWRLVTMFPDNLSPGWAPSLFLTPQMKQALTAAHQGFNHNVKDYHWTGATRSFDDLQKAQSPVPPW